MLNIDTIKDVKLRIAEWSRAKRREYGLSQEDLARDLGMSRVTIQQIEAGKNVTIDTLLKVAGRFDSLGAIDGFFTMDDIPESLY